MQGKTTDAVVFIAVFFVPDDRMTYVLKMDPDLILSSGFKAQFDKRITVGCIKSAVMRYCKFTSVVESA